ncbi:MAG: putative integral rane protein, partial [Actinomycetia bacterium]|nr:putative integral rane protein [Actinomycetes bacterium]
MLLADFGTGQVLWSLFYFFFFLIWIYLLFLVIADLFASHDLSGWAKAIWVAALIILPYIAVLAYLIVRGHKMQQHVAAAAAAQEIATRAYI